MRLKSYLILFALLNISCGTFNKAKFDDEAAKKQQYSNSNNGDSTNQQYVKVSCNGKEDFFDKKNGRTLTNDISLIFCISNKAFEGDIIAESQLAEMFPYLSHPFGHLYPFRGEKLFPLVLAKLNNFTIKIDEMAMSIYPYFSINFRFLGDMIKSINGQDVNN